MITEHSLVVLDREPEHEKLSRGDVGTVVHVYKGGSAYEVEFVDGGGRLMPAMSDGSNLENCCMRDVVRRPDKVRKLSRNKQADFACKSTHGTLMPSVLMQRVCPFLSKLAATIITN